MDEQASLVEGSERLTSIFGYWPSFHDAEVIEFNLWRGDCGLNIDRCNFPVLTTKIHVWQMSELDARGLYVLRYHTLATLRFHGVDELGVEDFNQQNVLFELSIKKEDGGEGLPQFMRVEFHSSFGLSATFRCLRIEVVSAEALKGRPSPDI